MKIKQGNGRKKEEGRWNKSSEEEMKRREKD